MSLILNIDTAIDSASICLAKDGETLQLASNKQQKDHAYWLHVAIAKIIKDGGYVMADLQAVAVSIGPGSYTGLRIGLSTAKGLCYALNIPLIAISTLDMMAFAAKDEEVDFICPMIDARRMEVFTAIYNKNLKKIIEPQAMLLDEKSFVEFLSSGKIIFLGNGSNKLQSIISNNNAFFSLVWGNASHLANLSNKSFIKKEFADLAYIQPLYLKEFYSPARKDGP
jgi:tRNA threonylcarbamoyladenosine biosynthesis protein TsaB